MNVTSLIQNYNFTIVHQLICLCFQELHKHKIKISESAMDILMTRANKVIQQAIRDNVKLVFDPSIGQPPKEEEYNLLPHPVSEKMKSFV